MMFKVGVRIVLGGDVVDEFQGLQGIVVSKKEFLAYDSTAFVSGDDVLLKLDRTIRERNYWRASRNDCSLLSPSNYNE